MASSLWLTDRSRYETGNGRCARKRYLESHAGPNGYGWARQAQSMPAVTGTLIHSPITDGVCTYLMAHDAIPPDTHIHTEILIAQQKYRDIVATRGLVHTTDPEVLDRIVNEQTTLLEGLVWTWVRAALPSFHDEWQVVAVEQERVSVVGCTCGLGDRLWDQQSHEARDCQGIGWMTRGDCITRRRATGTYAYHDFKSTGMNSGNWRDTWPHRIQVMAGVLGDESALDVKIDEVWIHPLYKGKHESTWDPIARAKVGAKFQNSPLVYGWRRPANEPLYPEDWAPKFDYVDEDGKARKLGKDYNRQGIWTLPAALWKANGALSPSHYWTGWIAPTGVLNEVWQPIGPIYRDDWKLEQFVRQLIAHETNWQAIVWELFTLREQGLDWETAEFQAALDRLVPQARGEACQNAFGDRCPMLRLCNREEGWQTPERIGFIPRRPHHTPELEQAIGRGLLPPEDGAAEEAEE